MEDKSFSVLRVKETGLADLLYMQAYDFDFGPTLHLAGLRSITSKKKKKRQQGKSQIMQGLLLLCTMKQTQKAASMFV